VRKRKKEPILWPIIIRRPGGKGKVGDICRDPKGSPLGGNEMTRHHKKTESKWREIGGPKGWGERSLMRKNGGKKKG